MSKPKSATNSPNGNGLIYVDNCVYRDGKLVGIGFKEGEHIPRASDYKLPKRLTKAQREMIETTQALFEAIREDYKNGKVRER